MSLSPDTLVYNDFRYGDRYEVELDDSGDFAFARRYPDNIGAHPVTYERLTDIPPFHRHEIEQRIWQKKRQKK